MTEMNPLLIPSAFPAFDVIAPAHAREAVRHHLAEAEKALDRLEAAAVPSWAGLMEPLQELGDPLSYAWGIVHHAMSVMNSDAWRAVEEELQPDVVALSLRVQQSRPLFDCMRDLQGDESALSPAQRRILKSQLLSATLSGVGLDGEPRARFNAIKRELAQSGTLFGNHVLDSTKAFRRVVSEAEWVQGLPHTWRLAAAQAARDDGHASATAEDGPWCVTLDAPQFIACMRYAEHRGLREDIYRAYVTRASSGACDNGALVESTLRLRRELAALLGYASYAEVSLASKMAPDVGAVDAMHEQLLAVAYPRGAQELAELEAFAGRHGWLENKLQPWDMAFWAERLRAECFRFTQEELRPYFQFPRVLEGLFACTRELFGVDVEAADGDVSVWHPDVRFFHVNDADGTRLASFYLDPYVRPASKRGGAWMNPARTRWIQKGRPPELPVAYLVCNQAPPVGGQPSLMTLEDVETLFHEFGHGLQHMLTRVDEPGASGINNVEWDAVELPSQFMEAWCTEVDTLRAMTCHVDTGEPMSEERIDRIRAARTFRTGSHFLRQLLSGMLDIELHHRWTEASGESIDDVKCRIARRASVVPLLPEDRFLRAFSHIFAGGYAAGYYGYKWAEVLSADAFAAFEEAGLAESASRRRVGRQFRSTVLAEGGGAEPMAIFERFRGRPPRVEALLRQAGLTE